ncbi:MAG: phosphoribosyltransferase domain-containing protein [Rhodocyclaceae bacterium]|nr:phosphoribosyltransferase domain-containing protein [Rhodocyclaceae bacterium]
MTSHSGAAPRWPGLAAQLPQGRIEVRVDHAEIAPEQLFSFATRNNPKRAFLFLSHVLGKHLPVTPARMTEVHDRIAAHIPDLPQPVLFAGMAETATCLGQGVFESWLRSQPGAEAIFLHTTRYQVAGGTRVDFEEVHSHAPLQWLYEPDKGDLRMRFRQARSLVLIDDEISTGNTFLNLCRALRRHAPHIARVHLAAITDFTGAERRDALHEAFGLPLSSGALLYGKWTYTAHPEVAALDPPPASQALSAPCIADSGFGRAGRTRALRLAPDMVDSYTRGIAAGQRVLVLGTGEFMHAPYVFARELQARSGAGVSVQATTRSPILAWGPIRHTMSFADNYGEGIANYLYNCDPRSYDHIFLCHETGAAGGLHTLADSLGARLLHFRSETCIEETAVRRS